jgi:hypothetical protein
MALAAAACWALQIPDQYPHWLNNSNKDSYHSETMLGQMYDRVQQHPINKQLQDQLLTQENDPERYRQQLHEQADAIAAAWMQRLQGSPLLPDAVVLLPQVADVMQEFDSDLTSLMNNWHVHDVGEYATPGSTVQPAPGILRRAALICWCRCSQRLVSNLIMLAGRLPMSQLCRAQGPLKTCGAQDATQGSACICLHSSAVF